MDILDFANLTPEERKKKKDAEIEKQIFKGSVELFRDIQKTKLWTKGDGTLLKVYIFCLLRANVGKKKKYLEIQKVWVGDGEFITGRFSGSKNCNLSDKTFKIKLNELEKLGLIKQEMKQSYRIITVSPIDEGYIS